MKSNNKTLKSEVERYLDNKITAYSQVEKTCPDAKDFVQGAINALKTMQIWMKGL